MKTLLPHILLVGNDSAQTDLLTTCLDALGILPVGPAVTAAEALALYDSSAANLVVLNAALGAELTDSIGLARAMLDVRRAPIIFLTKTIAEAAAIRKELPHEVVCVTKPYTAAYLQRVIQLLLAQSSLAAGEVLPPLVVTEVVSVVKPSPYLFVRERGLLIRLEPALIASVKTEGKYCLITMASGHRYTARIPMSELRGLLEPAHFVQAHRAWLVNMQYIEHIDPTASTIHLLNSAEIPLGRAHRAAFFLQLRMVD